MLNKTLRHAAAFAGLLLFAAGGCGTANTSENSAAAGIGGEGMKAESSPGISSKPESTADIEGGAPVPAKRENLTATDRAAFLRAVGLTDFADNSERFVDYLNRGSAEGAQVKNAGMTFHTLGGGQYLVEIVVDRGARADTNVFALYRENGGKAAAKALNFDSYSKSGGEIIKKKLTELNGAPKFDEQTRVLTVVSAARGTGGCGSYTKYKITGDRAETIEVRSRECTNDDQYNVPPKKWDKIPLGADGEKSKASNDAGGFEHLRPEHASALKNYLKIKPDLRPAVTADYDRANPKLVDVRKEYQKNHPYYAAGDFNRDGQEDFAVILKSRTAEKSFNIAVFNAPFDQNNAQPAFFGQSDYRYVLQIETEENLPPLYIGSYASDDGFGLQASGKSYKILSLLE